MANKAHRTNDPDHTEPEGSTNHNIGMLLPDEPEEQCKNDWHVFADFIFFGLILRAILGYGDTTRLTTLRVLSELSCAGE